MFSDLFKLIVGFISNASVARAIAFGLISGMMLTQWVKFQLPDWLSDHAHADLVRTLASLLTLVTVLVLWPTPLDAVAWAVGVGCGLTTPFAYWLGVKCLYHFFPWTEDMISARPTPKPCCPPEENKP